MAATPPSSSASTSTSASAPPADTDTPAFPGLTPWRVPGLPPSAFYIADFITAEEEELLLRKISETPQPKWRTAGTGRRLQYWGGTLSPKNVLLPEEMPSWLTEFPDIIRRIDTALDAASGVRGALGVNQVLINEYQPGQGISPHEDGAAFRPLVATVSLGAHTVLDLYHYVSPTTPSPPMVATAAEAGGGGKAVAAVPLAHLLLLPRSLLVLTGSLYQSHLHGIAGREGDLVVAETVGDAGVDGGPETEAGAPAMAPVPSSTDTTASDSHTDADREATSTTPVPAPGTTSAATYPPVVAANADLLRRPDIEAAIASPAGWTADRGTRVSLTFRRANKVLKGGSFALVGGKLRRH